MARRKYSNKTKIQPAVQKLWFLVPNWDGNSSADTYHHIDLSQCASLVNRRFYRQGINWAVSDMTFHVVNRYGQEYVKPGMSVTVTKLPNTWVMSNSWEKSFRTWQKMNREALSETPSVKPKFLDFKIYANDKHHAAGFGSNLLPVGHTVGEWESSKAVIPYGSASPGNVLETEFIAVGGSYPGAGASGLNAVSLIEGYAASRGLPNVVDPNTPADADDADGSTPENWMSAMFNDGIDQDSDVLENLISEQNRAPYPYEGDSVHIDTQYPGGANNAPNLEIHSTWSTPLTSVGTRHRLGGGNFPCGLIQFQSNVGLYDNPDFSGNRLENTFSLLEISLVPGTHRGYLCEPMTEM